MFSVWKKVLNLVKREYIEFLTYVTNMSSIIEPQECKAPRLGPTPVSIILSRQHSKLKKNNIT